MSYVVFRQSIGQTVGFLVQSLVSPHAPGKGAEEGRLVRPAQHISQKTVYPQKFVLKIVFECLDIVGMLQVYLLFSGPFVTTMLEFCPPKPRELDMAA